MSSDLEMSCRRKEKGYICKGSRGKKVATVLMEATTGGFTLSGQEGDVDVAEEIIKKMESRGRIKSKDDLSF